MMKVFIGIGVETYQHSGIKPVRYAEADICEFAKVLEQHGFDPDDGHLLVNSQATKTSIESIIRTTCSGLSQNDTLFVHFAGHGVSVSGVNYITCYDTRTSDMENTCIEIEWLFEQFKISDCEKIALFLDSCRSGMVASENMRDIYSDLDPNDLKRFLDETEFCVCFAACKADQKSHSSSSLKHGIWTYHLIEAFDGRASKALTRQSLLVDSSLQNYLKLMVPITLRDTDPKAKQTPWSYGAKSGDFNLADLANLLESRRAAKHPREGQIQDSILLHETTEHITRLTNFEKKRGHFVPENFSVHVDDFVGKLVGKEIEDELNEIRDALKHQFDFSRLECKKSREGGSGTVTTPYFNYNISVGQDDEDCESVVWRRSIEEIIDPDKLLSDEFESIFGNKFTTVELTLYGDTNIVELIDFIEGLKNRDIKVEYDDDEDVCSCIIRIKDHAPIHLTKNTFAVVQSRPASPKVLFESLFNAQIALTQAYKVLAIPFEATPVPKIAGPSKP